MSIILINTSGTIRQELSYNRYAYGLNNPFRYTDESGELFGAIFGFVKGIIKKPFKPGKWFESAYTHSVNEIKMIGGLFKGSPKQILSRLTWESPQTAFGLGLGLTYNYFGTVNFVDYWGGATVINTSNIGGSIGMTLGSYILGGKGIAADPNNKVFQHEYGHYLQSQKMGPAYLSRVAVPSFFDTFNSKSHSFNAVEQDANARAFKYFNENVEGFYKTEDEYKAGVEWGWHFNLNPLGIFGYGVREYVDYNNSEQMQLVEGLKIRSSIMDYASWINPFTHIGYGVRNYFHYNSKY